MNKKQIIFLLTIFLIIGLFKTSVFAIDFGKPPIPTIPELPLFISLQFKIKDITASSITIGSEDTGSVDLVWQVGGTKDPVICEASGGWSGQKQTPFGTEKITYSKQTTNYTLTCYKQNELDKKVSQTATINVRNISLSANPQTVILGESTSLNYNLGGFDLGESKKNGLPTTTTTKFKFLPGAILDLAPKDGVSDDSKLPKLSDLSCSLYANDVEKCSVIQPLNFDYSDYDYSQSELPKCNIQDEKIDAKILETPTDDTTYTLKCTWSDEMGKHQSSSNSVLVKVARVDFDVYPKEYYKEIVEYPVPILLGWQSKYFQKCEASSDPSNVWSGEKPLQGQETASVNGSTTFTLTCSGIDGDFNRKKSITQKVEEKSLFDVPVWIMAKPPEVNQGEEVIVSWGKEGNFDTCSLTIKPLTEILAYSNDTPELRKCSNRGRGEGSSSPYFKIDPECFKNIQYTWETNPKNFALSEKDKAQMQKDPNYYKSFNIGSSGYGSIKIKPEKDTELKISCIKEPREVGGGTEKWIGCGTSEKDLDGDGHYEKVITCVSEEGAQRVKEEGGPYREDETLVIPYDDTSMASPSMMDTYRELGYDYDPPNYTMTKEIPGQLVGGGSTSASVTIKVLSGDQLRVSLSADPTKILKGEKTTLTYSSLNADPSTHCIATSTDNVWKKEITPDDQGKTSGEDEVTLDEIKTYNFSYTCWDKDNKSKTATAQVEVEEEEECLPPNEIPHNECQYDDEYQSVQCVSVNTCGQDECSDDVNCPQPPPPSCNVTLKAIPKSTFLGRSITLEWWPTNCDSCQATTTLEDGTPTTNGGNWQGNPLTLETTTDKEKLNQSHKTSVTPLQIGTYIYKITCNNAEAEAEAQVTAEADASVKVLPVPFWREIIPVLPGFLRGLFK